jgi:hypothetical protein
MINFMDQESFLKSQHTATQIRQQQNMKVHRCVKKKSLPMEPIERYIKPITKYFVQISINGIYKSTPIFPMYSIFFNRFSVIQPYRISNYNQGCHPLK